MNWTEKQGSDLPERYREYLSDVELAGTALGGPVHWAKLAQDLILPAAAAALGLLLLAVGEALGFVLLAGAGVWGWLRWYVWHSEPTYITGKRVIVVTGIIIPKVAMMPLGKLTDMQYGRTPLGLVCNYGYFRLESAGQKQAVEHLRFVPDPNAVYRHIQNLLHAKSTQNVAIVNTRRSGQ